MRIGIDLMGGELPPSIIFEAVLKASEQLPPSSTLVVFAHHEAFSELKKLEKAASSTSASIEFITTEQIINEDDSPLFAVRRKKNSSMAAGMRLLKEKSLDGFVSMGNTGALVATAMVHVDMLPGIERPALLVVLPAGKKGVVVLDVGANLSWKPSHLVDYARLGTLFSRFSLRVSRPKVGLLNIGTEQEKGTRSLKEAYKALQSQIKEFKGNIEGREVFENRVDVVVTEGFTGNVFLKTCEGVCSHLINQLKHLNPLSVGDLQEQFNYSTHPGAVLIGIDGLVVKCHGYSDVTAITNGILGAHKLAKIKLIEKIKEALF